MHTFQSIIARLSQFWANQGCLITFPYDIEKGAGTSNPNTFLRALGPEPFSAAYVEPCRRPKDGRYGQNPNRLQHYYQFQVILKPSPDDIVDLYIQSLEMLGLDTKAHDIRFVHDDWENPTLGASGLGWEVWIDGMEMTQFTYFQTVAGIALSPITGEITYGIERIAMCLQGVDSIFDIRWNETTTYGELFRLQEKHWSRYNFELQDEHMWMRHFEDFKQEAVRLIDAKEPLVAYDFVLKASHAFNMLDAKGVISVTERASYIAAIRDLSKRIGEAYVEMRKEHHFPLCKNRESFPSHSFSSPSSLSQKQPLPTQGRFVLEIGMEELPASFVPIGIRQLEMKTKELLAKEKITYRSLKVFGTPRRLAVLIEELVSSLPETCEEKKGPPLDRLWESDGSLTQLGVGFFQSLALSDKPSLADIRAKKYPELDIREIKGIAYLYILTKTEKRSTLSILEQTVPSLILSLEFPKMMHWGAHALSFPRPIRWIMALFDTIPLSFSVGPITSSNWTRGHRLLSNDTCIISSASTYEAELEKQHVLVDQDMRRKILELTLAQIEKEHNAQAVQHKKVIAQVLYLVEYPFIQAIPFAPELLDAPKEVIVSEMVEHQKYFPLQSKSSGDLLPFFIVTAHIPPNEYVQRGNIKVLSARLNDGRFLWQTDCATALVELNEKLSLITYQKGLGSLLDKASRIRTLSREIGFCIEAEEKHLEKAARLCKADLASHLVGEFPELQGIIGSLLAKHEQLDEKIVIAMREHWLPNQEGGPLPSTAEGVAISLADKFDTLLGFFALGHVPSSSHDPYALRRQALGIVRMIVEKRLSLSLRHILTQTKESLLAFFPAQTLDKAVSEVLAFILQRAKVYYSEKYSKNLIEAIFANEIDSLLEADAKLESVSLLHTREDGKEFIEVLKRTIGQIEGTTPSAIDSKLFEHDSERKLFEAIHNAAEKLSLAKRHLQWKECIQALVALRAPLSAFFASVRVLHENEAIRTNRLGLLWAIFSLLEQIAEPRMLL